jgi:hypothetical protein
LRGLARATRTINDPREIYAALTRSQRPRPAAGKAECREPAHAQIIGNRMRIGADRCQPERRWSGSAVARAVERDQPGPVPCRQLLPETKIQPGSRGPVEVHHYGAIGITRVTDSQDPPAANNLHLAHLTIVMPPSPDSNQSATDRAPRLRQLLASCFLVSRAAMPCGRKSGQID